MGKPSLLLPLLPLVLLSLVLQHGEPRALSVEEFGACSSSSSVACAQQNSRAFFAAGLASRPGDSIVWPSGSTWYYMPFAPHSPGPLQRYTAEPILDGLNSVTISIKG